MELIPISQESISIGQLANRYAASNVLSDYHSKLSDNTLERHKDDLSIFSAFLREAGAEKGNLMYDITAWDDITFGLLEAFKRWQLERGYAIASINAHLSTVKVYAQLAAKANIISTEDNAMIKSVRGYNHKEGRNIDKKRDQIRVGKKKSSPVTITKEQAKALKAQPDTPQGRRDSLLMCLLLDHGLRCGEVAALAPKNLDLDKGLLVFYRPKVDKVQTHRLTRDTLLAAMRYLEVCKPKERLLMGSRKGGKLEGIMGERSITDRVRVLGELVGVKGLSAHDCRHDWATDAIRQTDIKSLQQAGGWSSADMPLRYAEDAEIANEGVKLTR